ncbi:polysaccharide deacetylase family protein [Rhizobium herbae]|uniref:Polysaccharide deacetylase family protein n=1 Tax=Rhizobium herbae TaxID=508661 RepID=A0ABS7H781_9HYPH|nr:polysaccharide deacetylase family protein [Rhizobium herbae]MBW9062980.1 polysaccharide deacetylase family protein [Rhizobium herbae]
MDDFARIITEELDRWQQAGKVARFWLRDDDAVEPSEPLERLLEIAGAFSVPLTLAVIPAHTGDGLARRLEREPLCAVAVHGWSHVNHAGADEKKQELGRHRPASDVLGELQRGFNHLADLHPNRFVAILVPPWNRIDAALVPQLAGLGFEGLSVYGPEKPSALPVVNTHVDVMDWHGTRGGRDRMTLAAEIVARLGHMFDHAGSLGLLTHHLVHDEAVWDFLKALFESTARHPGCRWCRVTHILRDQ